MGIAIQAANPQVPPSTPAGPKKPPPLSGLRKAAILMVLLGDEAAVEIYRNLNPDEVRRLTQEIAEIETISPQEAVQILEEYRRLTLTQEYVSQGGPDYANHLLLRAFGDDRAKGLLEQVVQAQQRSATNLDSLQKVDPEQLVKFLEGEHPQTIALILAHLGMESASSVLPRLPEKVQADAIKRLAQMQQFSNEMLKKVSLVLHKKLAGSAKESRRSYGGVTAAAGTLNRMDSKASKLILESLQNTDPDLAEMIRNQMFTFEDLGSLLAVSLREILAQLDKKTLATALKGAREEVRAVFYSSMSSRAADMLKEDMEALGPLRLQQVQQAQKEVVALARKLEAEGKISLKTGGDDGYVE
jgi:flagellar motor switch protein FliG